ncbi:MAG: large-conductance mechanosensitive channel protein MscL [Planctomycetes bacterium]|nr:large-conductance mechanosensitive channel protein MscL [Planctomycetota bacterium]
MGMLQEFKKFALRGNVMDMAVGIIIGGAFGTMVKSLVDDVIMPPIGYVTSGIDFKEGSLDIGEKVVVADGMKQTVPAMKLKYGSFINSVISFLIVAWAVFLLVKAMNAAEAKLRFGEIPPSEAPPPPENIVLLREIRDSLKRAPV